MNNKYIFTLVLIIIFAGCGSDSSDEIITEGNEIPIENVTVPKVTVPNVEDNITLLSKLNNLRVSSGLNQLSENTLLAQSALNHAIYLNENNFVGHYEIQGYDFYTGVKPVDRALYAGYKSKNVSENVSVGQETEDLSLSGLMGAIYHRFGFLSFDIDEIGYAKNDKSYVYNMGNSNLSSLCDGENFDGNGRYYFDICLDETLRVEYTAYNNALDTTIDSNPSYVVYPYNNQIDVSPAFFEENPDPLPDYGVSGNPISIEFNSNDFNMSKFALNSFTLRDNENNQIELIEYSNGSSTMNQENDVNEKFSEYQFAIFSKNRLDYNQTYLATFSYTYDNEDKEIEWSFETNELENLLIYENKNLTMNLNESYYLYIKPENPNDIISKYSTNCSYTNNGNVNITGSVYDANTLKLNVSGTSVKSCVLTLNDNTVIEIDIN